MSERGVDAVWVGTFAGLNEGDMRGGWLELPYDEEALGKWLREAVGVGQGREEYGIFDADLNGPLGEIGVDVSSVTRLETLNMLAMLADRLDEREVESVRAYASYEGRLGALELGNLMARASDIPCYPLPGTSQGYSSPEERLGYALVGALGGVGEMTDDELLSSLDYGSYGRDMLIEGRFSIGPDLYVDMSASAPSTDYHGAGEFASLAQGLEIPDGDAARRGLVAAGCPPREIERFAAANGQDTLAAAAAIVSSLSVDKLSALALWARDADGPTGPAELANAALDIDSIDYGSLRGVPGPLDERMGRALADRFWISREDLEAHFDYERYGRESEDWGEVSICGESYLDLQSGFPDMRLYDMDELHGIALNGSPVANGPSRQPAEGRRGGIKI